MIVTVVGAGLVGSLLAALLVRRGHGVTVYERRLDPRTTDAAGGRSINLVVTRRGIRALERAGLDAGALALTVPVFGRMIHDPAGALAYQPYGRDDNECNHSISRAGLNAYLIDRAEALGARFHFGARLVDVDAGASRLAFEDEADGGRFEVDAPVVFAADGAGSAVRASLSRLPGFQESVDILGHSYKELRIPPGPGGEYRIERNALHLWPRGELMLMALPNLDGSFTATLYLPNRGDDGFERLDRPAAVRSLFERHFPDALALLPDLATEFFANPTGSLGTVRCRPWHHGGRVLLLGDAAHAIVPFFGQGMNAGFEDCTFLDELLQRHRPGDWGPIFEAFYASRKPDADAIADLALENFVEMRDRVADPAFLLRKQVEHRLEQEMPLEYRSRYSMVMYSHIPFRIAAEAGAIHSEILDELCSGIDAATDLDLERARGLVRRHLAPFLRRHGVSLDY